MRGGTLELTARPTQLEVEDMADHLRMTFTAESEEFCLSYSDRELNVLMGVKGSRAWFPEGERLVAATGIFANFSVATGQDTQAQFEAARDDVLAAAEIVLEASQREARQLHRRKIRWADKLPPLIEFLRACRAETLHIRHHYAHN